MKIGKLPDFFNFWFCSFNVDMLICEDIQGESVLVAVEGVFDETGLGSGRC